MQRNLSQNEINRGIAWSQEEKERAERQIAALEAKSRKKWLDGEIVFPSNKSSYNIGPLRRVLADTIYEILREERPLHRRIILNRAVARGIVFTARKPISHVSQILTQDPRFERVRNEYGFRKRILDVWQKTAEII